MHFGFFRQSIFIMRLVFPIFPILILSLTRVQGGEPLTLQRAIDMALKQNPEMEISRQKVVAADGRRIHNGKWPNPEIEVSVEEAPFDGGIDRGKTQAGLQQEFPFPGKKQLDRQIGKAGVEISNFNLLSVRLSLIRDVKIAFFEALATERQHTIAKEILALARNSSDIVTKRLEAGRGSVQEQLRAEIETERSKAEVEDFRQQSVSARQRLAALVGDATSAEVPISGSLIALVDPGLLASLQSDASDISRHPKLAAAQAAIDQAALRLKRERLERMPNLTAGFEAGRDGAEDESIFGLKFSLPLPLVNRRKGAIQEADAELKIAQSELGALELALTTRLRSISQKYVAASTQVITYRDRILPKSEEAVKLTDKGYGEGRFTLTDLLDTQRTTAAVRLIYQDKLLELLSAQAEIEALIDHISESTPLSE